MSKMYFVGVAILALAAALPLRNADAASLSLYSDSSAYNHNDSQTFVSNPRRLVISPVPLPPGLQMFAAAVLALGGLGVAKRCKISG